MIKKTSKILNFKEGKLEYRVYLDLKYIEDPEYGEFLRWFIESLRVPPQYFGTEGIRGN